MSLLFSSLLCFFYGCSEPKEISVSLPQPNPSTMETEFLSKERYIRRLSITLLGRPPFPTEIEIWNSMDEEKIIDDMLDKPEVFDQLTHFFSQWLLTQVEDFNLTYNDYHLDATQSYDFLVSIGEEAPRFMSFVATQQRPWTEIVTADYTVVNDLLFNIWPLKTIDESSEEEWFQAQYTDGRPAGGVLMTNGLWWRYYTTPNNNNRSRAAALMNLFLCENMLLRPIRFQATALLEADAINDVIQTDEACIGCHSSLDPLASAFFGFWWFDIYDQMELSRYHPEREFLGEENGFLNTPMAYFGQPLTTPAELGIAVSKDPRFISCTVEKTAQLLWQRNLTQEDQTRLAAYQNHFTNSSLSFTALLKNILLDDEFQAATIQSSNTTASHSENRYLLQPYQLQSIIIAMTGFLWEENNKPLLQSDQGGYRQLLGGVDGREITRSVKTPTLSRQLVLKRLAQNSADHWVQSNWEHVDERGYDLLQKPLQDLTDIERQTLFKNWVFQTSSIEPTTDEITQLEELFAAVLQEDDEKKAYAVVISVILRSIDFWSY